MELKTLRLTDLKPADYNPRKISEEELNKLKKSITEFGLVDPIIINHDFTVIGGHQRLKAMQELGKTEVPCIVLKLDKQREKALNIALNKISGKFDEMMLQKILEELSAEPDIIELTGFGADEIDDIINSFDETEEEIKKWEMDEIYIPFWLVIRGPIENLGVVKEALQKIKNIHGIKIEASA